MVELVVGAVEAPHDVVERLLVGAGLADFEIEQQTDNRALIVIGDGEVAVAADAGIAPGVEAGVVHRLIAVAGGVLVAGYRSGGLGEVLVAGHQTGAEHEDVLVVGRKAATQLMGDIPYKRYTFLMMGQGNGGIEHLNSMAAQFSGTSLTTETGYRGWLSYIAHEYFHNFNVKCIRPLALGRSTTTPAASPTCFGSPR